jgi:Putative metallopeptidase
MKSIVNAAAWSCAMIVLAAQATPASAQIPADLKNDQIDIAYVQPKNSAYRPIYDKLKQRQVLEQLRAFMAPLSLTRKLPVKIDECSKLTSPYEPGGGVTICYEYIAEIERLAPKEKTELGVTREVAVAGAFVQFVLHEMAHATFDVLQIPVWGREEDAADKLAGFIMMQFGKDVALTTLTGTAHFFEASDRTWTGSDFSDVRSPEAQRYYNYLCLAHGGPASEAFKPFLTQIKFVQLARAKRCATEYSDLRWAFQKTILPHVDQDLLQKVQVMPIFLPGDVPK